MIFTPTTQQEKVTLEKIGELLSGLSKNILKTGSSISLPKFLMDLEHTSNEICYMLQARDQNEYGHAIIKYTQVWKDVLKSLQNANKSHTEGEVELEPLNRAELMQRMKKKLTESGQTGRLGGVRIGGFQSPLAEAERIKTRQGSSKNSNALPSIRLNSFDQQTDRTFNNSSRMQYEIDEQQKSILNEVLKQSNKLNVQIVMKRYDPKIKLCISQGTDTNLDILEVMRNFKKEYHENKLHEIQQESDKHSQELQKFLNERIDHRFTLQTQAVNDKLKTVHKQMIQKSMDIETIVLDAQKQQQQELIPNILGEFLEFVNESYQNVQHETYKVLMKFVSGFIIRKLKTDQDKKLPTQNSQQMINSSTKERKAAPIRRADNTEQLQKELSNKNVELDKKFMENAELWNKIRQLENQIVNLQVELESTKMNMKQIEQDKTSILYEKQKFEKQLSIIQNKTFQDQAIQVSDQSLQLQVQKLQKENTELQQKIYQLTGELNKKKSLPAEQKSLQIDFGGSQEQSNKDSPKATSKIKSQQFDFGPEDDNVSLGYRTGSNRQIQYSDYTKRQSSIDYVQRMSVTQHIQSQKDQIGGRKSSQSQDNKRIYQHSFSEVHPQKQQNKQNTLDQKSIQELDEEQQMQKSGLLLPQQQLQTRQSVSPQNGQILRKMSTISKSEQQLSASIARKSTINQVKYGDQSIPDVDQTQAQTIQDTQRTTSGNQLTLTDRKQELTSPSDRRIQTEVNEQSYQQFQQQISTNTPNNKINRSIKKSETTLTNNSRQQQKYIRKSTDTLRDGQGEQFNQPISNRGSTRIIDNSKQKIQQIKEEDEISRPSKSRLSSQQSSQSHIRRSSTTIQQQSIRMAIKVNDENQAEYLAQWKQKTVEQEQQTDIELLQNLIEQLINNMKLPSEIQQKVIESIQQMIEPDNNNSLLKKQISFKNVIQKYGYDTNNNNQDKININSNNQSRKQSNSRSKNSRNSSKSDSNDEVEMTSKAYKLEQKQESQKQLDLQKTLHQKQKSSKFSERLDKKKETNQFQRQPSRQPMDPQQQKEEAEVQQLLAMASDVNLEQIESMPYEELIKQIQEKENDGKQLENLKPNEMKGDNFLKTLYNQIANKKTKGIQNVQELLRKFYKKGKNENITFYEFKAFYQRLAAIHKMCGQDLLCNHLQRFIMRLGFTCTLFSKRQLLKTNTSIIKPFNSNDDTATQSKMTNTHNNLAQSRFTNPQFYLSEEQFY